MPTISRSIFGYINDTPVHLYTITNENNFSCKVTNYGCAITSIMAPDKNNVSDEVVIGFDRLSQYYNSHPYIGTIVGRTANRISNSTFILNGATYQLNPNLPPHHLHGGKSGFDKRIWNCEVESDHDKIKLIMKYVSPDGEENYPGNLSCQVTFTFYNHNQIDLDYKCTTDKSTLVNLTHHDYFNLNSGGLHSILDHQLCINSDAYTEVDNEVCPTGKILTVSDTQLDFREYKSIRDKIVEKVGSINMDNGYDNNFIIHKDKDEFAASLRDPVSRRQLNIYSDQPCLQLYTPVHIDGSLIGAVNANTLFPAVCLESQAYPDSINQDNFPSSILNPGEVYAHHTSYRFSIY